MLTDYARHLRPPMARPPAISPGRSTARGPRQPRFRARGTARWAIEQPTPKMLVRDEKMKRLEAVLFLAKQPLHARKLSQYANLADGTEGLTLIRRLNNLYDKTGRSFRIEEVANGWQLRTRRKFANWLRRLPQVPEEIRLSPPAIETLAVVAFRQPVVRAEVESVRGVACGEILRQLMEKDLIRVAGRSEELGRPYLYSTTNKFLQVFGLRAIEELPRAALFQEALTNAETSMAAHSSQDSLVQEDEKESAVSIATSTETIDTHESLGPGETRIGEASPMDDIQDSQATGAEEGEEWADEEYEYDDEGDDDEGDDDGDDDDGDDDDGDEYEYIDADDDDEDEEDDFDDDELEDDEEWDDDDEWEEVEGNSSEKEEEEGDDDDEWDDDELDDDELDDDDDDDDDDDWEDDEGGELEEDEDEEDWD